jgi:hypothetical protein
MGRHLHRAMPVLSSHPRIAFLSVSQSVCIGVLNVCHPAYRTLCLSSFQAVSSKFGAGRTSIADGKATRALFIALSTVAQTSGRLYDTRELLRSLRPESRAIPQVISH